MKFTTFFVFSLLSTSFYANSKPVQPKDEELESAFKKIKDMEEFFESLIPKINSTGANEEVKNGIHSLCRFTLEMIELKPFNAIEIAEKLLQMEELVHEASEIQSEDKDLEEVLKKIKELEEVINKQRNYQKTAAIDSVKTLVDILEPTTNKVNENPNNFTEILIEAIDDYGYEITFTPKYLPYLIKSGLPKMFEKLWIAELAVVSVKLVYPSEAEQLKRIIGDVQAKLLSLKRETKRTAMLVEIDKNLIEHSECSESLTRDRQAVLQNNEVDIVYKRDVIVTEDEQEELVEKILSAVPILDRVNDQFIEDAKNAIELFKSRYPEQRDKLDRYVQRLRRKFDDFVLSCRTLAKKIKLDTAEGVRTNPLYIEAFSRITQNKFADVYMSEWGIYKNIEVVIIPLFPTKDEDHEVADEVIKALAEAVEKYRSVDGPLDDFLKDCRSEFIDFPPGLFEWLVPNQDYHLYTNYLGFGVQD